ncbi:MAG: hypothetical protein M1832_002363 [Thelocarpon impressellum]|nr:MAG: hypothetical protein M1832_002363 [Thelocarpon impressellum]
MAPSVAEQLLAACLVLSTYVSFKCFTPPHPDPNTRTPTDRTAMGHPGPRWAFQLMTVVLGLSHACLTLYGPSAGTCPNGPANLNPALFAWSPLTRVLVALLLTAGAIRLYAYQALGRNFTFKIAPPSRLVTSGIYGHVQHPSYTTAVLNMFATVTLLFRRDGVAGCWLPVGWSRDGPGDGLGVALLIVWFTFVFRALRKRVQDEEAMMEAVFGDEWREWHAATKRFIPGVV